MEKPLSPLIMWKDYVEDHDFDAALNYLSIRYNIDDAKDAIGRLRKNKIIQRRANDVLRAARLDPIPLIDPGVKRDLLKVIQGKKLSPCLLIDLAQGVEVADGYHRISLVYNIDPFENVHFLLG